MLSMYVDSSYESRHCYVCESEWKVAGCPLPIDVDDITVVPSTQEFYQRNKDQVFVCLSTVLVVLGK